VSSVAIEDGRVTSSDLSGVVKNDDLSVERSGLLGGVVLGVRADVSSSDVLDGNVPEEGEKDKEEGRWSASGSSRAKSTRRRYPRKNETHLMLKPTLSPGTPSTSCSWCISTDLTSVVTLEGAKLNEGRTKANRQFRVRGLRSRERKGRKIERT